MCIRDRDVRPRGERKDRMHGRQPAELARHVVGCWRDRAERWAPDHDLGVAKADEVRQVRVSAGKLRELRLARGVESGYPARGQALAKPGDQPRPLEILAVADRARVFVSTAHRG